MDHELAKLELKKDLLRNRLPRTAQAKTDMKIMFFIPAGGKTDQFAVIRCDGCRRAIKKANEPCGKKLCTMTS